jgi:hypothetical protein
VEVEVHLNLNLILNLIEKEDTKDIIRAGIIIDKVEEMIVGKGEIIKAAGEMSVRGVEADEIMFEK